MTATEIAPTEARVFRGRPFAMAWRSVAIAWSKDKARPVLDHSVAIEVFDHGIQLISTDSYVLLHAWVPEDEYHGDPPPLSEMPTGGTFVAQDSYGRSIGLMAHVLNLTSDDDAPPIDVTLTVGEMDEDGSTFAGMERQCATLAVSDQEVLRLPLVEGEFPQWRALIDGFSSVATDVIALQPEIVERLAKLGKVHGNKPLSWRWGGTDKMALIEIIGSEPHVAGLVMPVRVVAAADA